MGTGGTGAPNPAAALADHLRDQHQHHQRYQPQQHQQQQQPAVREHLPVGMDASAGNVMTVHDANGNVAGYQVWPTATEMQQHRQQQQQQAAVPFVGAGGSGGVGRTSAGRIANGLVSSGGGGGMGGVAGPTTPGPVARPSMGISIAEVASMSDDGIMLRHVRERGGGGGFFAVAVCWLLLLLPFAACEDVEGGRFLCFLRGGTEFARRVGMRSSLFSAFMGPYGTAVRSTLLSTFRRFSDAAHVCSTMSGS